MRLVSPTIEFIDSHTAGEPTRVVIAGGPDQGRLVGSELAPRMASDGAGACRSEDEFYADETPR